MKYKVLHKNVFSYGSFSIVPIRMEDRYTILKWRNEQIYHLRQNKPLTKEDQDKYFDTIIANLFEHEKPNQILFSYLQGNKCIGYGGLVHINWIDRNAEISFIMDTELEEEHFELHWSTFLILIQNVGFKELKFHKLFTYAFDVRPRLYPILEQSGFNSEAELKEHSFFGGNFVSVKIHSKINLLSKLKLRLATEADVEKTFEWANNKIIRKFSFNNDPIMFDNHVEWFNEKIKSSQCAYYILELERNSVGSIRFDLENNNTAKINYLIDPNFTGRGLGNIILKQGISKIQLEKPSVNYIYGFVFKENLASIKIFQKLGFKMITENENDLKFEKEIK